MEEENIKNIENIDYVKIYSEKPKISIIVPAFNTEKYIARCLSSLINQTEKEIEIIIINDGSDDNTEKIVLEFAKQDSRIVYIKQEHKLQGSARNNGIQHANGEYIGFVDSDDWVDLDYFEKLYNSAKKFDSDLSLATNVRTGNGKDKKRLNIIKEEFFTDIQAKIDICHMWKDCCPTNKIYRADFLRTNNISFPEGIYCEDKIFTTKVIYYSNGIVTVPDIYYYYYRNPNSTVKSKLKLKEHRNDKNIARTEVLKFLKDKNVCIRDKDFWAVTNKKTFCGIPIYTKKESLHTARHYILSFIKIKEENI